MTVWGILTMDGLRVCSNELANVKVGVDHFKHLRQLLLVVLWVMKRWCEQQTMQGTSGG